MDIIDLQQPLSWHDDPEEGLMTPIVMPNRFEIGECNFVGLDHKMWTQINQYAEQLVEMCTIDNPVIITGNDGSDAYWLIALTEQQYNEL